MSRVFELSHEFVEYIPERLQDNVLYISIPYATAAHLCCCGCGEEVVTPLSPTDWQLRFDGRSVSLEPSVGNWNFACQSHYWIVEDRVQWAPRWSRDKIEAGRERDRLRKKAYFEERPVPVGEEPRSEPSMLNFLKRLLSWLRLR